MWIVSAFVSLIFLNARNIITKFNVSNTHEYISMWYTFLFQIPIGIIAILFTGIQITDSKFFFLVLIRVILDIVAFSFFFKALKISKLSTILPFMALLPAITIFTSFFINGQEIQILRLILILAIVIGCYTLYRLDITDKINYKSDIKGITYILIVIGIYAVLDPLHAEIIRISAPFTYFFISSIYFILIWSIFIMLRFKNELLESFKNRKSILFNGGNGVILGLEVLALFSALIPGSITATVTAIRSTNIAVSSLLGAVLFKEKLGVKKIALILLISVLILLLIIS